MRRWINGKLYDTENAEIISYSEDSSILNFPKGYRFISVQLKRTPEGQYFLHGVGNWGCHSIVPITEKQVDTWLNLSFK